MITSSKAINFTAEAVMSDNSIQTITLREYLKDSYGLLIFYPLNFTFVCPTELIEYNKNINEFNQLNCKPLFISIDSVHSHIRWKKSTPEEGGIDNISIPMVSDIKHDIIEKYGVKHEDEGVALRGTFLIDKNFIIRSAHINDLPIGRNVNESIRIIKALIHNEKYGNVCPANWDSHKSDMQPSSDGVKKYFKNLK